MSGVEIYGAVAATVGLIKVIIKAEEHYSRAASKFQQLEDARLASNYRATTLRVIFKALSSNLDKFKRDIADGLSKRDREDLKDILNDIDRVAENCDGTVSTLKRAVEKGDKKKLEAVRIELDYALQTVQSLQQSFQTHISMEILRVVSGPGVKDIRRVDTFSSEAPTIAPLKRSPTTSTSASKSSSGASTKSTSSTSSLRFSELNGLSAAIRKEDLKKIHRIIAEAGNATDVENAKASALLLACRYRRGSMVDCLLAEGANTHIRDADGLGVMHNAIGESTDSLTEERAEEIVAIIKSLMKYNVRVDTEDGKEKRRPLHFCAMTGNYHAAYYILRQNATELNQPDGRGKTALYHACERYSPDKRTVKLLLANKATFGTRGRPKMNHTRYDRINELLDEAEQKRKLSTKG